MMSDRGEYRKSHLNRDGQSYDTALAQDPLHVYATDIETQLISQFIKRKFGGRIPRYLDFACGSGRMTSVIAPMAEASFGVDVSENMMRAARLKCPQTTFILKDITKERLDIEPLNVVSAFRFFGNADDELRRAALSAIGRCLKPGGILIFNNHRNPWSVAHLVRKISGVHDPVDLNYLKMRRMVREAGFRLIRTYGVAWWCIRDRWNSHETMSSPAAKRIEPLSRFPLLVPICPEMMVVARKAG